MPVLYFVIPCYNEQEVLPVTSGLFLKKLTDLICAGRISDLSRILFVNDGSSDETWGIITALSEENPHFRGISLSRNRGHQNALLAGLDEAKDRCDITVSLDCDGQDDINAVDRMLDFYEQGCDIVYGVRSGRKSDTAFKRLTAQGYYRFLSKMGAEVVYNHADYRLMSSRAVKELMKFEEVNLYLRGMVPLIGFKTAAVEYERTERLAGSTHYSLGKMLKLGLDGITSLSVKPLHIIMAFGMLVAILSFIGVIWAAVSALGGDTVPGWASMTCIVCFVGGVQLISLGIIGEYVGKIYLEAKHRPRYIISEKTEEKE